MKVALNVSPLKSAHQFRGIGSYTKNLAKALRSLKLPDFKVELIKDKEVPQDCDLVHYPFFDLFWLTLPLRKTKKTIVTIHDVIPLVFPDHFPAGIKGGIRLQIQRLSLKGVKRVICDSKNSKKDIVKYLGFPREKIEVVYLAPGKEFKPLKNKITGGIKKKYRLPGRFILYVGDINYHKNLEGLIRAFKKIKEGDKDLGLVLIGKALKDKASKESKAILQLIKELKLTDQVRILGFVPTDDLVVIYNQATVYCQPSFYEGFGLPVLEAMACGTPVVASKKASLPEIAGQAAVMVDPDSLNDLANGLSIALKDGSLREKLIQAGLKQARGFSWQQTAQETIKVYEKVYQAK